MSYLGVVASKANSSAGSSDSTTALINVPTGSFLVAVLFIASSTPSFTSFTLAGNTFTVAKQDIATNEIVIGYCGSTTNTVTSGSSSAAWALTGSASQADFLVLAFDTPVSLSVTPTLTQESGSASYSQSVTPVAGETIVWVFGEFSSSATQAVKSGSGTQVTPIHTTSRWLSLGYAADVVDNTTLTQTVNWGAVVTSVHTALRFAPTGPGTLSLTGARGAISSGTSRYGTLSTSAPTINALTGKKTTSGSADARFGELTVEYLNFGGFASADSRYGTLAIAVAETPYTGIKGATGSAVLRFGTLTSNTRGNLRVSGARTALANADARFGLLSLLGLDLTGLPAQATVDARFGYLLLHNRTPGVVTVRAENKGLVTIRIGD